MVLVGPVAEALRDGAEIPVGFALEERYVEGGHEALGGRRAPGLQQQNPPVSDF